MHEKYVSMLSTRRLSVTSWVNGVVNAIENKGKKHGRCGAGGI